MSSRGEAQTQLRHFLCVLSLGFIVPLKQIEYAFGDILIRAPYTPYSIYLTGIIGNYRGGAG